MDLSRNEVITTADVKWIRITTDMFDNRKIRHLRKLPEGNNIVLIWVMLLTMAGRCNSGGRIFLTETIPYTPEMLADELGFEVNTVKLALKAMEQLNMILPDDGYISITGWEEHQNIDGLEKIREQNRIRKQRQRENQKRIESMSRDSHGTGHDIVTHCHAIEEEGKKEKDISFIHPVESDTEDVENSVENAGNAASQRKYLGGIGKGVVLLSDEQMESLLDELSVDEFDHYVGVVADCELNGKPFTKKTHYQAILDMAYKDRRAKKK